MKLAPLMLGGFLAAASTLPGCQATRVAAPPIGLATTSTRNNCYSLLHQLLSEQKRVSLLRFIKREPEAVKSLVNRIAANSAAGAQLLEEFARHDATLQLDDFRLPPGETATRDAIAATKKQEILGHTGAEFELNLLLTQSQALSYGWHLAKVAAANETQPERARALTGLSEDLARLYQEVFAQLRTRTE